MPIWRRMGITGRSFAGALTRAIPSLPFGFLAPEFVLACILRLFRGSNQSVLHICCVFQGIFVAFERGRAHP